MAIQITLRLPTEQFAKVQGQAERLNIPINDLLNSILYFYYQNVEQG